MAENPFEKKAASNKVITYFNDAELDAFHELEDHFGLKRSALIKKLLSDAYAGYEREVTRSA